ncbi:MAG: 1-deoxy-D-xylulose-5-phosphate reductoisomerase [Ruminococcaceae bacterium]|nr:1-deoxy-D-xylulose-5-phosphate reductoisomerase [Oscillospiraceae bacterium]
MSLPLCIITLKIKDYKLMEYTSMILAGSTGSIGRQATDVAQKHNLRIEAISSFGSNLPIVEQQIRAFSPSVCAIFDEEAARELKIRVADTSTVILAGKESNEEMIDRCSSPIVLNSLIGRNGLSVTLAAIRSGKNVALANKETLVIAGELILAEARAKGVTILPVDSEHCAMAQCLRGEDPSTVSRILLTASGGPFFGKKKHELAAVTPEQTLAHPTWKMGRRITVDSATLMNKGFELIEAVRLFGVPAEKIDIVIHRESIIHSAVEYIDHTVIAQMSVPDMRSCIQYALTGGVRKETSLPPLNLAKLGSLSFYEPDEETFTLLPLARKVLQKGGISPAVLNLADELAVSAYLDKKISFTDIFTLVEETVNAVPDAPLLSLEDVASAERAAYEAFHNRIA